MSRRYRVDPDRIYLMGHSMGGYGTNNLATHHPDLFAAVAPAEGTDSADLHANLRNTPWFEMTAEEDLDTPGPEGEGDVRLAVRGRVRRHPARLPARRSTSTPRSTTPSRA